MPAGPPTQRLRPLSQSGAVERAVRAQREAGPARRPRLGPLVVGEHDVGAGVIDLLLHLVGYAHAAGQARDRGQPGVQGVVGLAAVPGVAPAAQVMTPVVLIT